MLILFLPLYFCLVYPSPLFPLPFYSSFSSARFAVLLSSYSFFSSVLRCWFYSFFSSFSYLPRSLTPPCLCKFISSASYSSSFPCSFKPFLLLSLTSSPFMSSSYRISFSILTYFSAFLFLCFSFCLSFHFLFIFHLPSPPINPFLLLSFPLLSFLFLLIFTVFIITILSLFSIGLLILSFLFFLFYFFTVFPMKTSRAPRPRASFNLFACHWRLVAIIHNFLTFPRLHFPPKIVAKNRRRAGWIGPAEIVRCWSVSKDRRGKDVRTVFDQNKQRNVWLPWPGQHQEASGNR